MKPMKELFLLDPSVLFFNHGSFGATPRPVFESYQRWQRELERQPVEFLGRRHNDLLLAARTTLAEYVGTDPNSLVFVPNATTAFNIIAHSLDLGPGDEVLGSDQEYGAMELTWRYLAKKKGFTYLNHHIPVPMKSAEEVVEDLWRGVGPHTRVITLSHITSPTAAILPVGEICRRARDAGILTLIDGAHAPGQIDLSLDALGADFYAGNLHKWVCAPKGSGFLYASSAVQKLVQPLIVSFGWDESASGQDRFVNLLQWAGTRDISPFLAVPDAIQFMREHDWPEVRRRCHALGSRVRSALFDACGVPALYPDSDEWYSQMGTASLPDGTDLEGLRKRLGDDYHIVIPVMNWNGHKLVRFSIQAYNSEEEVDVLIEALRGYIQQC